MVGFVPLGWSVFPRRLRVRYLLKQTYHIDLLLDHAFDFRPLNGDHNLQRRAWTKPFQVLSASGFTFVEVLTTTAS